MATSATYGTSSSGFKMSGLISGLDTESIVKQMSIATKNKINKQQQKLDLLTWKQNSYREVIDKINTFKGTYFDSLKPDTYLKSNYLMSAYKASSSNDRISVTASSSAAAGKYVISRIDQLAEKAKMESSSNISSGIKLDFSNATSGNSYDLAITLDGLKKDISFTVGSNDADTSANLEAALQSAFGTSNFTVNNGTISYNEADGIAHNFTVSASEGKLSDEALDIKKQDETMKAIGLDSAVSSRISLSSKLKDINFSEPLAGGSFAFEINGTKFTFDNESTVKQVIDKVNSSSAGVKLSFNTLSQKFIMESSEEGAASSLDIKQTNGNLLSSMFGKDVIGSSGNMSSVSLMDKSITGNAITTTDFTDLKNSTINVTVNGVTKTIGLWGYNSNGDKNDFADKKTDDDFTPGTRNVVQVLNTEMKKAFGSNAPQFSYEETTANGATSVEITLKGNAGDVIEFSESRVDDDGNIVFDSNTGGVKADDASKKLLAAMGLTSGATNKLNGNTTLASVYGKDAVDGVTLTINGNSLTIDENTTLDDFNNAFGGDAKLDFETGLISLNSAMTASDSKGTNLISKMFNTDYDIVSDSTSFAPSGTSNTFQSNGKNAILTVNGIKITNSSNQIKMDGTTINIQNASSDMIGVELIGNDEITVTTERDTSKAFDAVVKFVDDYNKLIEELHKEVDTMRPTSNGKLSGTKYDPLTEEQREEMSDKEIEKWEEKAQTGMLYHDQEINKFLSSLRTNMMTTTYDNFSIYDMGITVSSNYKDNGKLSIDESKLKDAFEKYPDKIQELMAGENGLITNMEKTIEKTVGTTGGNYGSLVRIAGIANTSTQTENTISKQISTYSDMIETLKDRYKDEQERYWKQFTNLEKVMNNYNSQSSWLSQQFGG